VTRKPSLIDRILGRRRRRPSGTTAQRASQNNITSAKLGDVVTYPSQAPEHDDPYLIVERIQRYSGAGGEWNEIVATNSQRTLWIEYTETRNDLFVTAAHHRHPLSLESIGLTEDELITLDEEHSLNNGVIIQGKRYSYRNSFEAFTQPDETHRFYLWDFIADDGSQTLAVTKAEGMPFEAYLSDVIHPEDVTLYPA
jgi:hypothetical protein